MVLNRVWLAAIGVAALAWSSIAAAQPYNPGEFLNLDLAKAVLSPKPLGPATGFTPGPLNVTVDRGNDPAQANVELAVDPKTVPVATVHAESNPAAGTARQTATTHTRVANTRAERAVPYKPRRLVARDPMEAQARDTRVQVWPCRSGGICNWKR